MRSRPTWESTRWGTFLILCALGVKSIHIPEDIQKFPWEVEDEDDGDEVTEEDVMAMQREMAAINEQLAKRHEKDNADNSALH